MNLTQAGPINRRKKGMRNFQVDLIGKRGFGASLAPLRKARATGSGSLARGLAGGPRQAESGHCVAPGSAEAMAVLWERPQKSSYRIIR